MPVSVRRSRSLAAWLLSSAAVASACSTNDTPSDAVDTSLYALVRTLDGVAFLPPLGPAVDPPETFDGTLLDGLSVVLESTDQGGGVRTDATFDRRSTPALYRITERSLYFVNVPAASYLTDARRSYRFRVLYAGRELGASDLSDRIFTVLAQNPALLVGVKIQIAQRPAPIATSLAPTSAIAGAGDLALTVHGAGFQHDSVIVADGAELATTFLTPSALATTLPASTLAAAGARTISVRTYAPGGGASSALTFTVEAPPPVVATLSPSSALTGSGPMVLTLDGAGFQAGATVSFGAAALETTFAGPTELTALVPAALLAVGGAFPVVVTNPAPGERTSEAQTFTVLNPAPVLTLLQLSSTLVGTSVTLTVDGASFVDGTTISFGAAHLATTYVSPTRLTAQLPVGLLASAGVVDVRATSPEPAQPSESTLPFTIESPTVTPPPPTLPGFWVLQVINLQDWFGGGDPVYGSGYQDINNLGYSTSCPAGGVQPGTNGRPGLAGEPYAGDDHQLFAGTYNTSQAIWVLPETTWCIPAAPEDVAPPSVIPTLPASQVGLWLTDIQAAPHLSLAPDAEYVANSVWSPGVRVALRVGDKTWQLLNLFLDFYPDNEAFTYVDDMIFLKSAIVEGDAAPDHTYFSNHGQPFTWGSDVVNDVSFRVNFYDPPAVIDPHAIPVIHDATVDLARTGWDPYFGALPGPRTLVRTADWAPPIALRIVGERLENTTAVTVDTLFGPVALTDLSVTSTEVLGKVQIPYWQPVGGPAGITVYGSGLPVSVPGALTIEIPELDCQSQEGFRFEHYDSFDWVTTALGNPAADFQAWIAAGNSFRLSTTYSTYYSVEGLSDVVTIHCTNRGTLNYPIDGKTSDDGASGNPAIIKNTIWWFPEQQNMADVLEPVSRPCFGAARTVLRPGESCDVAVNMQRIWPVHGNWNNYATVFFTSDAYGTHAEVLDRVGYSPTTTSPPARRLDIQPWYTEIAQLLKADAPGGSFQLDIPMTYLNVRPMTPGLTESFRVDDVRVVGPEASLFSVTRDPSCTADITWSELRSTGQKLCWDSLRFDAPASMAYDTELTDDFLEIQVSSPSWYPDFDASYLPYFQTMATWGTRNYTHSDWSEFIPEVTTISGGELGGVVRVIRVRLVAGVFPDFSAPPVTPTGPDCGRTVAVDSVSPANVLVSSPGQARLNLSSPFAAAAAVDYQFYDGQLLDDCLASHYYTQGACRDAARISSAHGTLQVPAGAQNPVVALPAAPSTYTRYALMLERAGTCPTFTSSLRIDYLLTSPVAASCTNGVQDQGETDVDCGGPCTACSYVFSAYDDQGRLIGRYDENGAVVEELVYLDQGPLAAVRRPSGTYGVATDHLGTPRHVTAADGREVWRWSSEPFGAQAPNEDPDGDGQTFTFDERFPGQRADGVTGLFENFHRTYDPYTGRYLEVDPLRLKGGPNLYAYVSGNPVEETDPTGLVMGINKMSMLDPSGLFWTANPGIQRASADPNVYAVFAHGNSSEVGNTSPEALAREIKSDYRYKKGMPVVIFACNAGSGDNSFAKRLAELLQAEVRAPNNYYFPTLDRAGDWVGGKYIPTAGSGFSTFSPEGQRLETTPSWDSHRPTWRAPSPLGGVR